MDGAGRGRITLRVEIASPTRYIEAENQKVFTGGSTDAMRGFPHLRKAHCMFGWDWGPRLPDAGIFREVSVLSGVKSRIEQVYITQNWGAIGHDEKVNINLDTEHRQNGAADSVDINYDITCRIFGEHRRLRGTKTSCESRFMIRTVRWWRRNLPRAGHCADQRSRWSV